MANNYFPIHGVLPPVVTPFTPEGKVDLDAFVSNKIGRAHV